MIYSQNIRKWEVEIEKNEMGASELRAPSRNMYNVHAYSLIPENRK